MVEVATISLKFSDSGMQFLQRQHSAVSIYVSLSCNKIRVQVYPFKEEINPLEV